MTMVYHSNNNNSNSYGFHDAANKTSMMQQQQQQQQPAESLFSIVMDDFRRTGLIPPTHYHWPHQLQQLQHQNYQEEVLPLAHHPFPPLNGASAFPSVNVFDDLTLNNLLQFPEKEEEEEDCDHSLVAGQHADPDHLILEPTPLNIPDCHTVAQAKGRFYVVSNLETSPGGPEMVRSNVAADVSLSNMSAVPPISSKGFDFGDEEENEMNNLESNEDGRFRLYQSELWNKRFQDLVDYQKRTGNCQVPLTYIQDPALARWVKRQRYQYKLMMEGKPSTMTPERVKALEDIGFVWDSQGSAWWERFEELVEFKRIHKHCNVPSKYNENPPLAVWVKCQRRQYKLFKQGEPSNITPQRIRDLESIGFQWLLRSYHRKSTSSAA